MTKAVLLWTTCPSSGGAESDQLYPRATIDIPPDVAENYLQGSNAEIHTDLCRKRLAYYEFSYSHHKRYMKRFVAY